ncbi:MAG: 5'-methylthioadenosine/adenosylhomocysteine nucleosidase [Clostridia bacterium]|nr:5'-methylthioadenosine/adenosylhomocysteine nucleosidase [Clostridia bacterium]
MKIGILCAGDREVAPFIPMIQECKITEKAMLKFYEGKIDGVDIVTLFSGVCKVNAAIATQILIDTYKCDVIINSGTAGGMVGSLHILDTVISEEVAYHDVDEGILTEFHPWLDSIYIKADERLVGIAKETASNLHAEHNIAFGRMVTGEKFIADEKRDYINEKFAPLSVDMETAAVAHVCYVNKIPFIAVRTITDTPDHSGVGAFEENCPKAAQIYANFVRTMLKSIVAEI